MAVGDGADAGELAGLQRLVIGKQAACQHLREQIAAAKAECTAAQRAGAAGIRAARAQMLRMRAELTEVRRQIGEAVDDNSEAGPPMLTDAAGAHPQTAPTGASREEERLRRQALLLEARALRHELIKWQHQAEELEAKGPGQDAEILRLKAELTHISDILESTRHAVRHHMVEQSIQEAAVQQRRSGNTKGGKGGETALPLYAGGHGNVEATAERFVREKAEERNSQLSGKAKRLSSIGASQQLLIQRLEKQVLKGEGMLDQKEAQYIHETRNHYHLRSALKRHSDNVVAAALGVPGARQRRTSSVPPGGTSGLDSDPELADMLAQKSNLQPIE